jgi:tyrosinase
MNLHFNSDGQAGNSYYVGYAPVKCSLKNHDALPGGGHVTVTLRNINTAKGGQVVFYKDLDSAEVEVMQVNVPSDGTEVIFYVGGKHKRPSVEDGDAGIDFTVDGTSVLRKNLMVRVRKDANTLTSDERKRFLNAFARLVDSNKYTRFIDMHNLATDNEIHKRASFLPWHRIFLLDLERCLQQDDPSVTIPYWDFQNKADKVFTLDFMGVHDPITKKVKYRIGHPFFYTRFNPTTQLSRPPVFDTQNDKPSGEDFASTMKRGPKFDNFCRMENGPHASAHNAFIPGPVSNPTTATQDPLFFMLHANIDRLWAEWQTANSNNSRFDGNVLDGYTPQKPGSRPAREGDFLADTLWPWNGITGDGSDFQRPTSAPGAPLVDSPITDFPGGAPRVLDCIDYQGRITHRSLGFDYDSVPFLNAADFTASADSVAWSKVDFVTTLQKMAVAKEAQHLENLRSFNVAVSTEDIASSLSDLNTVDDTESKEKALEIVKDTQQDAGIRVLALTRVYQEMAEDVSFIAYLLELIANENEPENLRKEAFFTLRKFEFFSSTLMSMRSDVTQTLRGMISDKNMEMRKQAIIALAQDRDVFIEERLIQGIENPAEALVSEDLAVYLLGLNPKVGNFSLFRKIVTNSSNNLSRANALFVLGQDPNSKELLISTFNNKKERFDIRTNSLMSLRNMDSEAFLHAAENLVSDPAEDDNLKMISISKIDLDQDLPESFKANIRSFMANR